MRPIISRRPVGPASKRRSDALPTNAAPRSIYRMQSDCREEPASLDPLGRDEPTALVEAILLMADEPLAPRRIALAAGLADAAAARKILQQLQSLYDRDGTAFQIEELAGGFQLLTRAAFHRWLAPLRRQTTTDIKLTGPARETLAIVAYRQPIGRADIEAIRGVHCGETLRLLMEKGQVKIVGRDDSLGRPVLYGTTKKFLQMFGLKSIKDLPRKEQLTPPTASDGEE